MLSSVLPRLRPYRRRIAALLVLQLCQTVATLLLPTFNAEIIDNGVVKGDVPYIWRTGVVMVAVAVAQIATSIAAALLGARIAAAVGRDLRSAVFRRVLDFSAREVGGFGTPSLITRTVNDAQQVQNLVQTTFDVAVIAPIMCVGGLVLAFNQDLPLGFVMIGLIVAVGVAIVAMLTRMGPVYTAMQRCIDLINRLLRERITGVRVVRAFVRDRREHERFGGANEQMYRHSLRVGRLMAAIPAVVIIVLNVFTVGLVWLAGWRIDNGTLQLGEMTALLGYLGLIVMSVVMLTMVFTSAPRAIVSAGRIQEVLDTEVSVTPAAYPVPAHGRGRLELRAAEFGYPGADQPVLRGIDLIAEPGEKVAIVGGTGSGKTTLLNLALRLFDVTGGAVLVNGVDVREQNADALTRTVGFVPQRAFLFSGTVASNLRYGRPDATDEELWRALEVVLAKDFVSQMDGGLDAPITQGGTNVSGGQRQRLAIARTLLRRPDIYLLDDCFSALDHRTEAELRENLEPELAEATVLLVTQRASSVARADRVVVLDKGLVSA
ncbi:ABC transporter ATP-binding protein [Amycolatopsis sp. YIM 10]|uniref:ABC transporter ATP-binding protein n=1 Tax=Amycolatopsis sp. YIM 10 TaxID=2653857 RepID=UPI0012902F19|nr:ABC transporter ATP-binding protein [Amycolatopsis sp. YIM 10]QFU93061.1 Putative multidrug export ATP-binding/permease protein [Amycolatopsis sp. YIM 10]